MMKPQAPFTAGVVLLLGLLMASTVQAQLSWRWFGAKAPDKNFAGKTSQPDPRRVTEINVEVAWLADPITFPYYLEAHVNNAQQLEVIGYVPDKTVREHALRTAQVYSSMPVLDSMKEHPSLLVRPGQMSTQQLQSSVLSSLKVALPKQYQQFKVECGNDGKVYVSGQVNSLDEKIAVSHSLRRLHGCTSVQNITTLPAELAQIPVTSPRDKTTVQNPPTSPAEPKPRSWNPWSTAKISKNQEPPLADPPTKPVVTQRPIVVDVVNHNNTPVGPILIPPVMVKNKGTEGETRDSGVIKVELPTPTTISKAAGEALQKRVLAACPKAVQATVSYSSSNEVRIMIEVRAATDISPIAESIFALPELHNYRPDLQFKIATP